MLKERMLSARLSKHVAWFMQAEGRRHLPNESGGILIGSRSPRHLVVTHATGPGPCAIHGRSSFVRDGEYTQAALEAVVAETEGVSDYLGEWHTHPRPVGPSGRDRQSMKWISENDAYQCRHPLLVILQSSRLGLWHLTAYQWHQRTLIEVPIRVALIRADDTPPIRFLFTGRREMT